MGGTTARSRTQQLRGIDRDLGGSYALGNRIAGGNSSFPSITPCLRRYLRRPVTPSIILPYTGATWPVQRQPGHPPQP